MLEQSQYSLVSAIRSLISNEERLRKTSQQYLIAARNTNPKNFVKAIITAYFNSKSLQDKHLCLLYLRKQLQQSKEYIQNQSLSFEQIVLSSSKELEGLSIDCFHIFLNKAKYSKYRNFYIDRLFQKYKQMITAARYDENFLIYMSKVLDNPYESRLLGFGFTSTYKMLMNKIVNTESLNPPQCIKSGISNDNIWISFILALCKQTRFSPPCQFIYKNLIKKELEPKQLLALTTYFNPKCYKFTNIQELYYIIKMQIQRIQINQYLTKCMELSNDGFQLIIQSILRATLMVLINGSQQQQNNSEASKFLIQVCSQNFFIEMSFSVLNSPFCPEQEEEAKSVISLLQQTISQYRRIGLSLEVVSGYLRKLFQKLFDQHRDGKYRIIWAMCYMREQIVFRLISQMMKSQILFGNQNSWIGSETIFGHNKQSQRNLCIYFRMVSGYCKNYQIEFSSEIYFAIQNLSSKLFHHLINRELQSKILSAHAFLMICSFLNFRNKESEERFSLHKNLIQVGYYLLNNCLEDQSSNGNGQSVDLVLQCLQQTINIRKQFVSLFLSSVKDYLVVNFLSKFDRRKINVYISFFRTLTKWVTIEYINNEIISIITGCFQSMNDVLQAQGCQLILKLIYESNRIIFSELSSESVNQKCKSIVKSIFGTGILQYIEQCYLQQDDNPLYAKILVQAIVHQQFYRPIQGILSRVIIELSMPIYIYYHFDVIWQAMVILYETKCEYTISKGIDKKVERLKLGLIEELLKEINIQQETLETNKSQVKKRWSDLPIIKMCVQKDSLAVKQIQKFIHKSL